jgi:hypothetical protein
MNKHIFKKTAEPSMMVGWWHCVKKLAAYLVTSLASMGLCPPSRPKHLALRLSIRNHRILIARSCTCPFTVHFPFGMPSHLVPLLESSLNFFLSRHLIPKFLCMWRFLRCSSIWINFRTLYWERDGLERLICIFVGLNMVLFNMEGGVRLKAIAAFCCSLTYWLLGYHLPILF